MSDRDFFGDLNNDDNKLDQNPFDDDFKYEDPNNKPFPILGIIIGLAVGVIIAFIAAKFILSEKKTTQTQEIPMIYPEEEALKMAPTDEQGMDIPNQDKEIYNISDFDTQAQKMLDDAATQKQTVQEPKEAAPIEAPKIAESKKVEKAPIKAPNQTETVAVKTNTAPKTSTATTTAKAAATTTTATPTAGAWQVQLAALSSEKAAQESWNTLKKQHGDLLANQQYKIIQADIKGRTYYRLRVVSLAKNTANTLCTQLKSRSVNCLVTK